MWHIIKAALLVAPRIIYSYFAWMISYSKAKNKDKFPVQNRYKKVSKLIRKANKALKLDVVIEGKENIPNEVSCFFSNHMGAADPLIFFEAFDESPVTFLAKIEVEKMPFVGKVFQSDLGLFLDRDNLKQQLRVMMKVQDSLTKKELNWVIYPEGTRNKDPMNTLLPFHKGTFRAAMKANVPIVPVACYGSFRALNLKHSYKKYPTYVKYLKPIYPSDYENKTTDEIAMEVQSMIQKEVSFVAKPLDHKRMSELHDKYYRFNKIK